MMANYSPQTKNNDQPLCRFAVIHISFSSFSPKAKVRIRHYARKPEARYAGGFFLLLTRFASNAREFWFTTNAYAYRLRELEKRPMRKAVTVKRWDNCYVINAYTKKCAGLKSQMRGNVMTLLTKPS